jgi:uncharacterized membrane protein YphA (DoxX/SURF4 family)
MVVPVGLSAEVQAFFRIAYGALLLGTLADALPHARRFFLTERWGGYTESRPTTEVLLNARLMPLLLAMWATAGVALVGGRAVVAAATIALLISRYLFISLRWQGVLRGMGAPGFLTYWLGAAVCLLEVTSRHAPAARPLAISALRLDFAAILLSAGFYKLTAGYARGEGMELGLVNPQWGRWWRFWRKLPTRHPVFLALDHLAWSTEIVAAIFLLVPALRPLGALLVAGSFAFVGTQIRLGFLCPMLVLVPVLYVDPGTVFDAMIASAVPMIAEPVWHVAAWPALEKLLMVALGAYVVVLPFVHAGLFYNLYCRQPLPQPFQRALEGISNFFGIIVWRVFSADLVDFFVRIERETNGVREAVTCWDQGGARRFRHVAEAITLTTLFTTLRYYPGNDRILHERLLRYARTIPCPPDGRILFELVSIGKESGRFEFQTTAQWIVDPAAATVAGRKLRADVETADPHRASRIHPAARPGTYAPARG